MERSSARAVGGRPSWVCRVGRSWVWDWRCDCSEFNNDVIVVDICIANFVGGTCEALSEEQLAAANDGWKRGHVRRSGEWY